MMAQNALGKKWTTALLLAIFIPCVDRLYLGYPKLALLKFLSVVTVLGFIIWYWIDVILIATNRLRDANGFKLIK